jgi:ATP-dependent Clp protease, protease subunit
MEGFMKYRIVYLGCELTSSVANELISQLLILNSINHNDIDMYINSPGGSTQDGFALIDVMRTIKADIQTICIGKAYSMAAVVLAAGKKGKRLITENSEVMIHRAWGKVEGDSDNFEVYSRRMKKTEERIVHYLSQWTNMTADQVQSNIKNDFFMNAAQSTEWGFTDRVLQHEK